ncbi:MAG: (Fe-S)-binding protein [Dehalococcoidales bacterium]|nr:(Fe-S)-binding protein [Dehalococcoidales bacterium]
MAKKIEPREIKKFETDLAQCVKCGMCSFWCPVYQEERTEYSLARGKNVIIRGLLSGDLDLTDKVIDRLNKCTLCKTCTMNCSARANIPAAVVAARADKVNAKGVNFPYSIVYGWLLPHRTFMGNLLRFASWFQGIFLPKTEGSIRHLPNFLSALGKGRQIPQIAPKFLRQMVPVVNKPPEGTPTRMRIGYFTGCMTEYVFPELGKHIIDFLTRNGVEVVVPEAQGCCGAPVYLGAGDFNNGRKLADTNTKSFADFDYVITDCASCASAIKDYKKFLADNPQREEAYGKFGDRVKDISEFLVDVLKLPASAYQPAADIKGKKVTWHDPCHLNRYLGVKSQPRQIIKSIPGVEYIEMPNADRCCGMAGTFSIYYYDLSKNIADKKIEGIKATGADIVVTGCPGCEIQLMDNTIRHKMPVKVMHIMELLQ